MGSKGAGRQECWEYVKAGAFTDITDDVTQTHEQAWCEIDESWFDDRTISSLEWLAIHYANLAGLDLMSSEFYKDHRHKLDRHVYQAVKGVLTCHQRHCAARMNLAGQFFVVANGFASLCIGWGPPIWHFVNKHLSDISTGSWRVAAAAAVAATVAACCPKLIKPDTSASQGLVS